MIKGKKRYSLKEVFDKVHVGEYWGEPRRIMIDCSLVKINSLRLQLFKLKGVSCQDCGIQGNYFRKDTFRGMKTYHFNLYTLDSNNNEMLMTKDHIFPKSKGGKDMLDNLQVLCEKCNQKKGNKI